MERRIFLQILGAFGVAPSVPIAMPVMATATPVAAASATYNSHMYGHALAMVRSRGTLSILDLQRGMHLTSAQAHSMVAEFAKNGIIKGGYSATGILNAIKPMWSNWGSAGLQSPIQIKADSERLNSTRDKIRDAIRGDDPDTDDENKYFYNNDLEERGTDEKA